ncbi:hypothetical protein UFOVP1290_416 [uncultured Caudovirales phage]|uniref:Uncharacterized protein n=1 Tax=uncultured Caudovirales phage TaxID=2100421 RepID=A0A6J5RRL9_9CAUD|nr:hypothetical protein UFOVP1290_416 [uncultured Caudovirales phage]
MIYAVSFKHSIPENTISIDVTSRSNNWGKYFSPFNLGPIDLYGGHWSYNLENGFQFSRVYPEFSTVDGVPSKHYWEWAQNGWHNPKPIKYPLGAWNKHLYHWWDGKKLSNIEAQNNIFLSLYKKNIIKTSSFSRLKELYEKSDKDIYLIDFEGYNHRLLDQNWDQVINNPDRPVGQAFALCMILEGYL